MTRRSLIPLLLAPLRMAAQTPAVLDVPYVRQVRAGCGSAAVAMVMQYWVRQTASLDAAAAAAERIDQALPASTKGIPGRQLREYLEAHGFSAYIFSGEVSDLENHLAKGRPVLLCIAPKGPKAPLHYVVLCGLTEREAIYNDPARGKAYRESRESLQEAWKVTRNWALLAVPRAGA